MKEGILASQTDYASKPLHDHLKRTFFVSASVPVGAVDVLILM